MSGGAAPFHARLVRITALLPLALVAGCFHYHPGSFADFRTQRWAGTRVALPCLDLAIDVARDEQVSGPVVTYAFGNRCDHDVTLDVGAVRVVARDDRGRELHLAAVDPRREIHPLALPALFYDTERIEYDGDFAERELVQVCVDVGALERPAPAGERWICRGTPLEAAR